jgi:RNA polymerase sigma-70 factor (ECF subfamily)
MQPQKTSRLSGIQTSWAIVFQAHGSKADVVISAQERLLMRYYRSVNRYLCAMVRDAEVAEELTHEFVVRFLRGDFKRADPSRGRFRDLLKQALRHLAIDYWRRKQSEKKRGTVPLPDEFQAPPDSDVDAASADRTFLQGWRKEIMAQAERALIRLDERKGRCYRAILRFKANMPKKNSAELAQLFSVGLPKPLTGMAFRQLLQRAREKLADLLVAEVARSLSTSEPEAIEAELIELAMHSYCRRSIARLKKKNFLPWVRDADKRAVR